MPILDYSGTDFMTITFPLLSKEWFTIFYGVLPYPLVNVSITMENHHAINGKIHYKWPFSIAMLVYQRVNIFAIYI